MELTMNHDYYRAYVEVTLATEVARLLRTGMPKPRKTYRITPEQIEAIALEVGPRVCRLALQKCRFLPVEEGPNWVRGDFGGGEPLTVFRPDWFREARAALDPTAVLDVRPA